MDFNTSVAQPTPVALDLRPPNSPSPLETLAQLNQFKSQQLQQQAAQQQLQTGKLQQQEQQLNLNQRQSINQAYQDAYTQQPNGSLQLDPQKLQQSLARNGHGDAIPSVLEGITKYRTAAADLSKKQQDVAAGEKDAAGGIGAAVKAAGYDPDLLHALIADAANTGIIDGSHYSFIDNQLTQAGQQDPSGNARRALTQHIADQLISGSPKQQDLAATQANTEKTNTETAVAKRTAALQELSTIVNPQTGAADPQAFLQWQQKYPSIAPPQNDPQKNLALLKSAVPVEKQPGFDIETAKANALKAFAAHPEQGESTINTAIPPSQNSQMNQAFIGEFRSAMSRGDLEGAKAAIASAVEFGGRRSMALDPAIQQQEVNKAVATESATSEFKIKQAVATAKALRMGDNPAVAGVPPAAVAKVQSDAISADNTYIQSKAQAEAVARFIDLAESGNKVAGTNIPVMTAEAASALNNIKRIAPSAVLANSDAGSLWDRIEGKIGKLAVGQPIPADVRQDFRQFAQTLGDTAYGKYTDTLNSLNSRTGAKFAPTLDKPNTAARGPAGQYKPGDTRIINGVTYTRDSNGQWQPTPKPQ